jgi:hypothetical protein
MAFTVTCPGKPRPIESGAAGIASSESTLDAHTSTGKEVP